MKMDIQAKKMRKNIAILGAGFAGIKCALDLYKLTKYDADFLKNYNIVLIDKKNFHLYTPSLYETATTAKADASGNVLKKIITTPIEEILKNTNIKFIQGEIANVNMQQRKIKFADHTLISFEYVVFALGSEPTYFGIEGLEKYSLSLKWLEDGIKIRNNIRREFLLKDDDGKLNVVIGGSGPNGVEFSAELIGYIKELNKIHNKKVEANIKLIDGSPHILPGFEHNVVGKAKKRLKKLGIKTINSFVISGVTESKVHLKQLPPTNIPIENFKALEKQEDYDILIWSGGVQASKTLHNIGMPKEKRGRIEIDPALKCNSPDNHMDLTEKVFAIGDNCCFIDQDSGRPIPGTARTAIHQAKIAAINIYNNILDNPKELYKHEKSAFSVPIGGKYAITKIGPFLFSGFFGWILKQFIELYYLYSITGRYSIIFKWWRGIKIFSKND